MIDVTGEVVIDAGARQRQLLKYQRLNEQLMGLRRSMTTETAQVASEILMGFPNMTADTAAAVTMAGFDADDPLLATIMDKDLEMQERHGPMQWAKAASRAMFGGFESWWEAGIPTWGRTAVRVAQGENPLTAFRNSATSYYTEAARQHRLGNPIEVGDGWFPNSTPVHQRPGYQESLKAAYDQSGDLKASMKAASEASLERYGVPLTEAVHDKANSTLVNKTHDGQVYSTPYSLGRALAIQISEPDTVPFQVMSSAVDFPTRIALDPANPLFYDVGMAMVQRNRILPDDFHQIVSREVRDARRAIHGIDYLDEANPDMIAGAYPTIDTIEDGTRQIEVFEQTLRSEYDEIMRIGDEAPDTPFYSRRDTELDRMGETTYDLDSPYGQHQPDLTYGEVRKALDEQGGFTAYEDFILEHELVHTDESNELIKLAHDARRQDLESQLSAAAKRRQIVHRARDQYIADNPKATYKGKPVLPDELVKMIDEAEDNFNLVQAEFHEFVTPILRQTEGKAQGLAWERLIDPDYRMKGQVIRDELAKEAGIVKGKWRRAVRPQVASEWLVGKRAEPLMKWLAKETRVAQIHRRIPQLPLAAKQAIARTDDMGKIRDIIRPYIGFEVSKTPKLGAAKYGDLIPFNPMNPGAGHAKHSFSSGYLNGYDHAKPGIMGQAILTKRRLMAESRPIVLNLYSPNDSVDAALSYMWTIRASDDEIEAVIKTISEAAGSHSYERLLDAYSKMTFTFTDRLVRRGYSPDDIGNVLDQMKYDYTNHNLYWVNNAKNPVHRLDDGWENVLAGVGGEEVVPRLSAALESQFSQSWVGLPNLRDTRRATSWARAGRENMVRGFGSNATFWNEQNLRLGLNAGIGLKSLDKVHSIWRNWMLLRFGWPVRVVGEEMLRAHAYGYGHWFAHPIDILAQVANSEAKVSLLGDSLKDIMKLDGLGAGGWQETDDVFDMSRVPWTTATRGGSGYESGMIMEVLQLHGSRLTREVAQRGVDDVYRSIMAGTQEGAATADVELFTLVQEIAKRADKDSTLYKMSRNSEVLRRHLESIDAMLHQAGGGRWIEWTPTADGSFIWRDMNETPIVRYADRTKRDLYAEAQRLNIEGRASMDKQSLADAVSLENRGHVDIDSLPDRQFVIVEDGADDVRTLVSEGTWGGERTIWDNMTVKEIEELEKRIVGMYDQAGVATPTVVRTAVRTGMEHQRVGKAVDKIFEMLMQKPSTALARSPHFVTRYTEEVARMYLTAQPDQRALIEAWVVRNGFDRPWKRAIQKMLDEHSLARVPGEPLDAEALAKGEIRFADIEAQATPDAYAASSGPDLRQAELDDLLVSMVDTEMQAEMIEQGYHRFNEATFPFEGLGSQGDITYDHYIREFQRRIRTGEITTDELYEAAQRIEAASRRGDDIGARMQWMWGPLDSFDNQGMLRYGQMSEYERAIESLLLEQGIDYQPGEFYFHGSPNPDLADEALRMGGITDIPDQSIAYMGAQGKLYVFRRSDFPPEIQELPRWERIAGPEARGTNDLHELGEEAFMTDLPYDVTHASYTPKPVASIDLGDMNLRRTQLREAIPNEVLMRDEAIELVEWLRGKLKTPSELYPDPIGYVRQKFAENLGNGRWTQDTIDEAIGTVVAESNFTDEAILDELTQLNSGLSGAAADVRGGVIADETATVANQAVPDAAPVADAAPKGRGASVPVKSMFDNRSIGILTPDEQLLERIDSIAKATALNDTKELFYDLTRRANFTDMARYVFPFGDAFLEQIRIWARAMTPVGEQTGQALKNWRRVQVGLTNARKSGFFSEDEFGNEVFNYPGAGRLTNLMPFGTDSVEMGATVRPDQFMMMNLTPRGVGLPGTHGVFVQTPAAFVQPVLDRVPEIRDLVNWFAFGDYGPKSMYNLDDTLMSVAPTTVRRFAEAVSPQLRKRMYADEMNATTEAFIESGDPQFGDDPERAEHTMNSAQTLGTWLAFFRIADGFFSPAQPRYEPELLLEAGNDPFWMSVAALGDEWRTAREFFKTETEAINYMRKRFGIDPLTIVGATREVLPRPVTKESYDYAQTNREFYGDDFTNSMMLWLPSNDLDPFYYPAFNKALNEGQRERLDLTESMALRQRTKGYLALDRIDRTFDEMAAKIEKDYAGDHRAPGWSESMQDLNRWRNFQRYDVYAMYPPVEPNSEVTGIEGHPSYHDTVYEVVNVGDTSSDAYKVVREKQPVMADWARKFSERWRALEQSSMAFDDANTKDWWLTSTSDTAEAIRQDAASYFNMIRSEAIARSHGDRAIEIETQLGWFMQRVIEPLFDGYSLDDEMFLFFESTPPPFLRDGAGQQSGNVAEVTP